MDSRRFATNYAVQLLGRGLTMAFGLITVGVLTRTLSTAAYGDYTTAMTFLQFFGVFVDFGLTLTLIVMISEPGASEEHIVGNLFSMRLLSGALVFGLAPLAVLAFPYGPDVRGAVGVGALAFLLLSGATLLVGVFQRHAAMWRAALAETVNRALLLGLVLGVASLGLGIQAVVAVSVAANLVWLVATLLLARPFVRIRPRFDWPVWKEAVRRSWPIAVSVILNLVYLKGDILFLSLFRPSSDVAVYGVAYKVVDVLTALPVMFMGLLLPTLVSDWSGGHEERFRDHLSRAFDLFAAVTVPLAVGAQVLGTRLVVLIAGEPYAGSGPLLRLLILALAAVFFSSLYGHAVVALNRQRPMIWGYALTAVLAVAGYALFIPRYGAWGAALVTVACETFVGLATYLMVRRVSGAVPSGTVFLKAAACSALMYGIIRLLPPLHVLLTVAVGAAAYLSSMVAVGGIDLKKLRTLAKPTA